MNKGKVGLLLFNGSCKLQENLISQVNLKYYTIDEFKTCSIINQTMDSFFLYFTAI